MKRSNRHPLVEKWIKLEIRIKRSQSSLDNYRTWFLAIGRVDELLLTDYLVRGLGAIEDLKQQQRVIERQMTDDDFTLVLHYKLKNS